MSDTREKGIEVVVRYVGHEDFRETVPVTVFDLKLQAMQKFELELAAAPKYVLQYDGADIPDDKRVDALGPAAAKLLLTLKKEPTKG